MFDVAREFVRTLWVNIRLADVVDIALIAGLLYAIITWLRDRVSRVVSFGILLIALVYGLARFLDLYLTLTVFKVGLVGIVLALILVFQEDIRRLFEQLRVLNPWEPASGGQFRREMETLVEAVDRMAQKRIGALIVLPGREALDVHLHGGIDAHAAISVPMLLSVFHTDTPGHDGAIVVRDGQIERFAVHLPLSTRHEKLGPGGTRHAAALGLAERCDALVIVVSEERGTISVGHEHELMVLKSAADLNRMIQTFQQAFEDHEHEEDPDEEGAEPAIAPGGVTKKDGAPRSWPKKRRRKHPARQIPRWVTRNFPLKFLALLLSVGLWLLFAYRVENIQRTYEIPIEYRSLSDDWSIQEPKPISARVELTGSERAFGEIEPGKLAVSVDLSDVNGGVQKIPLSARQVPVPTGVTVTEIAPQTLTINAQRMKKVKLPVKVEFEGSVPAGFQLSRVVSEPGRVEVEIPESATFNIRELETEPIPLAGVNANKEVKARIQSKRGVRFSSDAQPEVEVKLEVEPAGK